MRENLSDSVLIRELGPNDFAEFYRVRLDGLQRHSSSFWESADEFSAKPKEEHLKRLAENLEATDRFLLGAFSGDELLGMVGCSRESGVKGYHRGTIWGMYVMTEQQGMGLGRKLMDAAIEKARKIDGLEVLFLFAAQSTYAVKLYESCGFATYGIEPYSLKDNGTYYSEAMMYLKLWH